MEITLPDGMSSWIIPGSILIASLIISWSILHSATKISDGNSTKTGNVEETQAQDVAGDTTKNVLGDSVGTFETFTEYESEICKEDGKPVVYLFSTTWCPHCQWIKETFDTWAKKNLDKISAYHWEVDTNDDTLTEVVETKVPADALAVYKKFNPNGSIPTFVFGCRYGRVGNGYESENDLEKEKASFDAVMKKLI